MWPILLLQELLESLEACFMGNAKLQKHTLDPLKISGRCGRLMCCLRYEQETYKDLKAKLPARQPGWDSRGSWYRD